MALVQTSGKVGSAVGTAASRTFNAGSAFTVGNQVVVCISAYHSQLISSVSIAGTTATKDASRETDTFRAAYIFRATIANSGRTDVVVSFASSNEHAISACIDEWNNFTASPTDATGNAAPVFTTSHAVSTSGSTTQADEVVYACLVFSAAPGATTFPGGYTTMYDDANSTTYQQGAGAYLVLAATGTQTATWTSTNSVNSRAAIATYKLSGGGGASILKQMMAHH